MHDSSSVPESGSSRATCLLLAPHDVSDFNASSELAPLREALGRRGVDVRPCTGAPDAMAELMLHERARRARRTREPIVVVFVTPERTQNPEQLFEAASCFAPSAVFWEYQIAPVPRLTGYRPQPTPPVADSSRSAASRHEQPRLRLAVAEPESKGTTSPSPSPAESPKPATPTGASLLSDEELAMLLGDEPPRPNP